MGVIVSEFPWIHATLIVGLLVLIWLIVIIILLYKSLNFQRGTTIRLEITSGGQCVIVPVTSLSMCPSYWQFKNPVVRDIRLSSFPSLQLYTVWKNFQVQNTLTEQCTNVPTTISIGLITWYRLRTILQQSFCAFVLLVSPSLSFRKPR